MYGVRVLILKSKFNRKEVDKMAKRPYDATKEHAPLERAGKTNGRHPNKGKQSKHPVTGKSAR